MTVKKLGGAAAARDPYATYVYSGYDTALKTFIEAEKKTISVAARIHEREPLSYVDLNEAFYKNVYTLGAAYDEEQMDPKISALFEEENPVSEAETLFSDDESIFSDESDPSDIESEDEGLGTQGKDNTFEL
ncbi:MAG: hypothetical protein ACOYK9_05910 [Chlamydiia bacterium]